MAGTKAGAKKGYQTFMQRHGADARKKIASKGGKAAQAAHPELQRFNDREYARQMSKRSHMNRKKKGTDDGQLEATET